MTVRAPEEEHVREFSGSHHNASERQGMGEQNLSHFFYIIIVKM